MSDLSKPRSRKSLNGNYTVGYGKPPKEHQFRPSNRANPYGRKRGAKNRTLVIRQILLEPINVREGDQLKKMPKLEAILRQTCNKALQGDHKAVLTVIGLAQKDGLMTPEQTEVVEGALSEADKAILEDFKARMNNPTL